MKPLLPLRLLASLTVIAGVALSAHAKEQPKFVSQNNDSDILGVANYTDQLCVNPWGIASGTDGGAHVAENGAGAETTYGGEGQLDATGSDAKVIPSVSGSDPGTPTGIDENLFAILTGTANDFPIISGSVTVSSRYLYCTEDGAIAGSNTAVGSRDAIIGTEIAGAGYTGIALSWSGTGAAASGTEGTLQHRLYAANFAQGRVDVFDDQFNLLTLSGSAPFAETPPAVTGTVGGAAWSPFNIHRLDFKVKGKTFRYLMVAYALHTAGAPMNDIPGPGNGYIDLYTPDGAFVTRLVSPGGALNSPWGLAVAHSPKELDLDAPVAVLVGNHGDGTINAIAVVPGFFDLTKNLGQLHGAYGDPLAFDDLWALHFGAKQAPKASALVADPADLTEDVKHLYFSAGIVEEQRGLVGTISLK
ncbi:MAG TPA: TIGR03118 family protein [Chthoniobacteraceae bacterium]|jgi:uncharacterized protein (TIGR03118 family)|nr:TIGR03118 family protein [Chthoniobacteraceae bacterium]